MKRNKTRAVSVALAAMFLTPALGLLGGCGSDEIVLRVYNWEEYIDEGGEGCYDADFETGEPTDPIIDKFEDWYAKTFPDRKPVRVEYSTFGTNEDMYNEIKLGNEYDLLCPSDYMIMKLAAEGYLEKYDESFFDPSIETNYYIRNVSPYIQKKFETNAGLETPEGAPRWSEYAAGYMWGTTGFVYNPEHVDPEMLESDKGGWQTFLNSDFQRKITAKDNVRDTYFAALGVVFEPELKDLRRQFLDGVLPQEEYTRRITAIFNATDSETVAKVEPVLKNEIKQNILGFETDTGKADMVQEKIWLNYAWSGDAVYALDEAESGEEDEDGNVIEGSELFLNFFVPDAGTNLFFDGWVMTNHVNLDGTGETKHAAQAFVNYLSRPDNAMRNSYYIGYTSVIAGENLEMLGYVEDLYACEPDGETETVEYDLTYFFLGEDAEDGQVTITAEKENAERRQLYAQFPPKDVLARSAVMDYYREDASERINELWSRVNSGELDEWAIIVICLCVAGIALFAVSVKFGGKIDFFRLKPKKGYRLVEQKRA